jgi:cytochrome c-type biogenesis protein CcmF
MTEAAIHSRPTRDLYVALGEDLGDGTWTMRVYLKPLVTWIWGGCGLMALGGLLALSDRRYRRAPEHKPLADNATDHTAVQAMARP